MGSTCFIDHKVLEKLMEAHKCSVDDLAKVSKTTQSTVESWLRGLEFPSFKNMAKILGILKLNEDECADLLMRPKTVILFQRSCDSE